MLEETYTEPPQMILLGFVSISMKSCFNAPLASLSAFLPFCDEVSRW